MNIEQSEWRRGWKVLVGASVGAAISYGLFLMTAGLFIIPMQQEFGWSRSAVSIGPIVGLLAAGMAPFGGVVIDRFGARPIAIFGLVALGAIYILLSFTPANQLYLYSVVVLMAAIATITSAIIYCAGIVTWFQRNSGLAIGITMSGLSLVAAIALPTLAALIENYGWRTGYLALCGVTWVVGLPFVVGWFREASQSAGSSKADQIPEPNDSATISRKGGMDFRTAARDKRFWLCIAAFGGAALPIGGFMSQIQPLLVGNGFTAESAAAAGAVFALSIGVGRLIGGALLDRMHAPTVAAVLLTLPAFGALLLVNESTTAIWMVAAMAVFLIGMGQGAEADFIAFFTLRIFGLRSYATIYSTIGATVGAGMALGGLAFAALYDLTGGYDAAVYAAALIYVCAAAIALTIKVPPIARD